MTKYIGLAISIFLTLAGLGVGIFGCILPHWGVILAGVLIAAISGYGLAVSVRQMRQAADLNV